MILTILSANVDGATVQFSTEPDGVNPPEVIEVTIGQRAAPHSLPPAFDVRITAGNAMQFGELDSDEPDEDNFPTTIFEGTHRT